MLDWRCDDDAGRGGESGYSANNFVERYLAIIFLLQGLALDSCNLPPPKSATQM